MGMGKQGGKGTAPVGKPIMGGKPGGKVVGGGNVAKGVTPKGIKGNSNKAK
jgi:hypothetical protein